MTPTSLESRCEILGELWLNYRGEDYGAPFEYLFERFDMAFPLAFAEKQGLAKLDPAGVAMIGECWSALLSQFGHDEDSGFDDLDDLSGGEYA